MKLVITGAAGFIGSNFVEWLLKNTDNEVIGIDNFSTGYEDNCPAHPRCTWFNVGITNNGYINEIFLLNSPDLCYHFAAYASEGRSNYIRSFIHHNNTVGTSNVINACVNYKCKLVFASSVAVYSGTPPYNESTIPNPIDEYGLSKLTSEKSIQIAGATQGLNWCVIRPRNIYGVKQNINDQSRNVFGIWMKQLLSGLPITIYGDGEQRRSFTYIDDIMEPLMNAATVNKEIINLGSSIHFSINEAATCLSQATGISTSPQYLPERHEVKEAYCSTKKSEVLLNFKDNTSLLDGLKKMWAWAQNEPERSMLTPPPLEVFKTNHPSIK